MLRTVGHVWTEQRLASAVEVLGAKPGHIPIRRDPMLATRLARALQVPQVQILVAVLDRPDPAQWETRKLALALRLQHLATGDRDPEPAVLSAELDAIERELIERLGAALRRFAGSLDADVLAAAPASARDAELYGYLADPRHRRNRLQLAATFPLFLRAAAQGEAGGGAGGLIRRLVDEGAPLVKALAAQWAVAPSVLRSLSMRPVDMIGEQWESNIEALVVLLNALPAEFRPGADAAAWRAFNETIVFAESVFGRRPWTSPLALAWLRHAARGGWTADTIAAAGIDLQQASVALVDELRQALIESLSAECTTAVVTSAAEAALSTRASHAADGYLAGIAPRRLIALAQRYRRELAAARTEQASEAAFAGGTGFWPLLPGEYLSSDGSRIVVSLDSRQALLEQGRAVVNCLGNSHLGHYSAACARGDAFIVALLHAPTRTPLSTAEVRVRRLTLRGRLEARVAQHTAERNAPPSLACRDALAEAIMLLGTEEGQEHLRRGARALAARRRGDAQLRREVDLLPVRLAVKRTVGETRFDQFATPFRNAPVL